MPGLAGMPASNFVEQMKAFRAGSRPSSVMQQLAKGFNDAQVDQLARYFAAQPAGSKP
jgi:cytochrome c553